MHTTAVCGSHTMRTISGSHHGNGNHDRANSARTTSANWVRSFLVLSYIFELVEKPKN